MPEVVPKRRGRPPKPKTDAEVAENVNLDAVSLIKSLENVSPKKQVTKTQKADQDAVMEVIKQKKPKSASKEKIKIGEIVEQSVQEKFEDKQN